MRKAGAKEDFKGSIGSEGAVSAVATGRRSGFMIRLCTCTGRSSGLRNLNNPVVSMTCKGCGGESTSDRGGPSCSSKLNTMGLELPRPIDPEVRWKTVNRRQRAARRARTSFSGEDRMKDEIRSFYACGNATNQELAQDDAPVSESEKLGVSILGRRFSDPVENVPIKKRRFLMDCSPSPPPTPLLVDPYEKLLSRSCGGVSSHGKRHKVKTPALDYMEEKKGPFDADDFSGISILAAAACTSELDDDTLNAECSKSAHCVEERKPEHIAGNSELNLLNEIKEDMPNTLDASNCKSDQPLESSESAPDMKPPFTATLNSENVVESADAPKACSVPYSAFSSATKADEESSASDTKSSGAAMSINSSNPDKSVGRLEDIVVETKGSNGTRDLRLHWDLNVAMEAWDTSCDDDDDDRDIAGPDPAFAISSCSDAENATNKLQACQAPFDSTVAGNIPDLSEDKIPVIDAPKDACREGESDFTGDSSSQPLCSLSPQNVQILESKPLEWNDSSAGVKDLPDENYVSKVESHLGSDPDCSSLAPMTERLALTANEEKLDASQSSVLGSVGPSQMASADGHDVINSVQMSELGSRVKPLTSRLVSEESTNLATVTILNKSSTDLGCSNDKFGQASQQSISEFKNQDLLDVDSGTSKIGQSAHDKLEHGTDVLSVSKRTADVDNDFDLTDSHMNGNPDCGMAHTHEEEGPDTTISHNLTCANSSIALTYRITDDAHEAPFVDSECTKPSSTDMDNIVDLQSAEESYTGKVLSNNFVEQCNETEASHVIKDLTGMGNIGAEDDSQYEDGELRESGEYWGDDGYEEVKPVNNQALDCKSDAPGISPFPLGSISKNIGDPVANFNGTYSRKEDGDVSQAKLKRSWSTNCIDDGSGNMCAGSAGEKALSIHLRLNGETRMNEMNPGHGIAGSVATISQSERGNDGLGDDLSSLRTKPTGWDMLPEDQRQSQHDSRDTVDSSNRCVLSTSDTAAGGESLQHMESSNGDMQPQADRPRSFDKANRNELCRSDDGYGSGSKAERTTIDVHRSHERGGASRHIQSSSRVEQWVENSSNSRSTRNKSPDYYNYGLPGPRNAAEAAVAKMQSNGFVVAPDGTLVKAVDAANASKMARRVRNDTLSSSYRPLSGRGSPIERDGGCGVSRGSAHAREASPERRFGTSGNRSFRYDPDMDKGHTDVNMSSVRCSLSSRQRRFPPHRASLNLARAHSQSPSGSRSRSPHAWTSPRNRREIMANGSSSLWRHSRSRSPPNYMTEVRMGRMTSPSRQPGFGDRVMCYSPSSRDRAYPQHASPWADGRNCSTVDLPDHKKRYSRRSPPLRVTSRNDRFDVNSDGCPRSGELYRPTQGRLPYGFERGRGNRHDGNGDDQREYADRYETHSFKPYDRNGNTKQFRNHAGDKLRPRISAPRSPEPQRMGSPRRFDRGFKRQLGVDLPRGTKEDNKNPFRYD